MKKILFNIIMISVLMINVTAYGEEKKGEFTPLSEIKEKPKVKTDEEMLNEIFYAELKEIEFFNYINVVIEGDDAKKIGLDKKDLTDYVRLRFKNNFAKIKYVPDRSIGTDKTRRGKAGAILCRVWIVGDDYPIAYHVSCRGGNYNNDSIWEHENLGIGSKRNVPETIKRVLNKLIEYFAIDFFKIRGEM